MKTKLSLLFIFMGTMLFAQVRNEIHIPDIMGYKTLKCDLHLHTVFSDGKVWPTVRVDEAYSEGLDAIAITDHIEHRPFKKDIVASHNRSSEIAQQAAKNKGLIAIKGSEITRGMPPGHFNAIFLQDCDSLDVTEWKDAFIAAKKQNAFIFWNHPGWKPQQPDTTRWWDEHTELHEGGFMHGIEVVNGISGYSPEAHGWALEKKLTMLGNTDMHPPSMYKEGEHRPMTLVFAKEKSEQSIKEALINRRTVVYMDDKLIGEEIYLKAIAESSVEILNITEQDNTFLYDVKNNSDIPFYLEATEHDPNIVYFETITIEPHSNYTITIKLQNGVNSSKINFKVTNLLVAPNEALQLSYVI